MKQIKTVLFVCAQGRLRSVTAATLAQFGGLDAYACGTDEDALVPLTRQLALEADIIICMERSHRQKVLALMGDVPKEVISLGIPDEYDRFDAILIDLLIGCTFHQSEFVSEALKRGDEARRYALQRQRSEATERPR